MKNNWNGNISGMILKDIIAKKVQLMKQENINF